MCYKTNNRLSDKEITWKSVKAARHSTLLKIPFFLSLLFQMISGLSFATFSHQIHHTTSTSLIINNTTTTNNSKSIYQNNKNSSNTFREINSKTPRATLQIPNEPLRHLHLFFLSSPSSSFFFLLFSLKSFSFLCCWGRRPRRSGVLIWPEPVVARVTVDRLRECRESAWPEPQAKAETQQEEKQQQEQQQQGEQQEVGMIFTVTYSFNPVSSRQ